MCVCLDLMGLDSAQGTEPDRATWKNAYKVFIQAFKEPTTESEKKKRQEKVLLLLLVIFL